MLIYVSGTRAKESRDQDKDDSRSSLSLQDSLPQKTHVIKVWRAAWQRKYTVLFEYVIEPNPEIQGRPPEEVLF